jgi:hypothetical protein
MLKGLHMNRFARATTLLIALVALCITLAGCGSEKKKDAATATAATGDPGVTAKAGGASGEVVATTPVQVASGNDGDISVSEPTLYVINSKSELKRFKKALGSSSADVSVPDFKKRQLVAVVLPTKDLGTQLAISKVTPKTASRFTVEAIYLPPGKGCKDTGESSVPFTIVDTDKMNGTGKLKITKQRQSPC